MDLLYDNLKRKKSRIDPGQPISISTLKRNIHRSKVLCIWDMKDFVYYELLKPNQTITAD